MESGGARPFPCPWSIRPAATRPLPSPRKTKPRGTQTPWPGPWPGPAGTRSVDFMGYQHQHLFCTPGARPMLGRLRQPSLAARRKRTEPDASRMAPAAAQGKRRPSGSGAGLRGRRRAGKSEARLRPPVTRGENRGRDGPLVPEPPNSQSGERRARPERAGADPVFPPAGRGQRRPARCGGPGPSRRLRPLRMIVLFSPSVK